MKINRITLLGAIVLVLAWMTAYAAEEEQAKPEPQKSSRSRIVIYPVLFQVPIYGASVDLPSLPGGGGGGGDTGEVSRSTDFSWDSAVLAGLTVERDKWFVEFEGQYAGLSGERNNPFLKIKTDVFYFNATGGWRFYNDFAVTGGVKRITVDIDAALGDRLSAHVKPGLWDPMIGVDWRRPVGKSLWLNASFQGGGFGVGTDVDLSGKVVADWEVLPHFVLDAGYCFFYYKLTVADVTVGNFQREFASKQTLHGPRLGLGFTF